MDLYLTEPVGPFPQDIGAAFNTFTTKKSVDPLGIVPVLLPGKARKGTKLDVLAHGEFSTTGTPNLTMGFWIGTRALAITIDLALSSVIVAPTATAWPWIMRWTGMFKDVGAAGSLVGQGTLQLGSSLTAFSDPVPIPITQALRTVAVDTSIERALGVSATWSTSAAGNSITVYDHRVLILN